MLKLNSFYKVSAALSSSWLVIVLLTLLFARIQLGYIPTAYNSEHDPSSISGDFFLPLSWLALICSFLAGLAWLTLFGYTVASSVKDLRSMLPYTLLAVGGIAGTITLILAAHYQEHTAISGFFDWWFD